MANSAAVDVTRGALVESAHRGALAVVDATAGWCRARRHRSRRSIRARPSRCCRRCRWSRAARPSASASTTTSSRSPARRTTASRARRDARAMLAKAGLDETALECGAHWPYVDSGARARALPGGRRPRCTTTARASTPASSASPARHGRSTRQGLRRAGASGDARGHCGARGDDRRAPREAPRGIDGCSIPDLRRSRSSRWRSRSRVSAPATGSAPATRAPRRACAPAVAAPSVHGRRHRPLRHRGDDACSASACSARSAPRACSAPRCPKRARRRDQDGRRGRARRASDDRGAHLPVRRSRTSESPPCALCLAAPFKLERRGEVGRLRPVGPLAGNDAAREGASVTLQ